MPVIKTRFIHFSSPYPDRQVPSFDVRFPSGIVLHDDRVVVAADIVRYMRNWSRDRVRNYCREKGWKVSVVSEADRQLR
jgi:hypothetical protein